MVTGRTCFRPLRFRDSSGAMLRVDDERLFPVWRRAGEMGLPVLIHVSDPMAFFLPNDASNEHYLTLREFPGWSFAGSHFSKWELLEQRNRMIARHPARNAPWTSSSVVLAAFVPAVRWRAAIPESEAARRVHPGRRLDSIHRTTY